MINDEKVYMCPCGGNNHVVPLWNWFPYNGHYDDVYLFGQHQKTTCSGKKGMISKNKSLFIKHLRLKNDIRHNLIMCYVKKIDGVDTTIKPTSKAI